MHVGEYQPPDHYLVAPLMDDMVNMVNRTWEGADPVVLAAFVLWRLNAIHPFINGNGRTARAACYFVLCLKLGGWLPGKVILPELIRRNRDKYVSVLKEVDAAMIATGSAPGVSTAPYASVAAAGRTTGVCDGVAPSSVGQPQAETPA